MRKIAQSLAAVFAHPDFRPWSERTNVNIHAPVEIMQGVRLVQTLIDEGRAGEALPGLEALEEYFHLQLAETLRAQARGQFARANIAAGFECLRKAVRIIPSFEQRLEMLEMGTYYGQQATNMSESGAAESLFELLREAPDVAPLQIAYARFLCEQGMLARAVRPAAMAEHLLKNSLDNPLIIELLNESERIRAETSNRPTIVLSTLSYSGASAIDPILRDILSEYCSYDLLGTNHMSRFHRSFLDGPAPLYIWTHSPVAEFAFLLSGVHSRPVKFFYLYRDPRDNMVSRMKDFHYLKIYGDLSERDVLLRLIDEQLAAMLVEAQQWLDLDDSVCCKIRFHEMKADIPGTVGRLLDFAGLSVPPSVITEAAARHSFEAITKRPQGAEGPIIRHRYQYRKGVSGEWRKYFDEEVKRKFKELSGDYVVAWGYEANNEW